MAWPRHEAAFERREAREARQTRVRGHEKRDQCEFQAITCFSLETNEG
jgi:hypothetical protein